MAPNGELTKLRSDGGAGELCILIPFEAIEEEVYHGRTANVRIYRAQELPNTASQQDDLSLRVLTRSRVKDRRACSLTV